ncbi:MAG: extracellular solute-binding protein [Acidimicrobiia bacterium]
MKRPGTHLVSTITLSVMATLAACSTGSGSATTTTKSLAGADPGKCTPIDLAVSPEKITLMTELAQKFNASKDAKIAKSCVFIRPAVKASGLAEQLLEDDWPDEASNGARPVVWSPASRSWGAVLNQRRLDKGKQAIAPADAKPFMNTPLVIAMPKPMADALGYPNNAIGFADIVKLARSSDGWAAYGHPEWGPFRLGKTNPNFSTSGLSFTIAEYYAATGKTSGLTVEDLGRSDVIELAKNVESAVVHYGDTTLTFLNNWYAADARGTGLTYTSAVAVEEKSVIDYNQGNPDGRLDPGEKPRPPRVPLVAIYPKEGTLYSDNPFIILDAPWVNDLQKQGALKFQDFVSTPENQAKVLQFGFRPGNPAVALSDPINVANGVDPGQPQTVLEVPKPAVMTGILDAWAKQRKGARVMLVVDVSGSMGESATGNPGDPTKLDLAKQAAITALDQFKADDLVGLRVFSTRLQNKEPSTYLDLVPVGPISGNKEELARRIRALTPVNGTPLYEVTASSYDAMLEKFDPARINAIVLLTDGRNDDGNTSDDRQQLNGLLDELSAGTEGASARAVRIFPIRYGADADKAILQSIADATSAASYDASNPTTINQVFTAVISNF